MKTFYVYILASVRNGTLYVGVSSDLVGRTGQHKTAKSDSFTNKYDIRRLVYYEQADNAEVAMWREKNLKGWNRSWKIALIEKSNTDWRDLSEDF